MYITGLASESVRVRWPSAPSHLGLHDRQKPFTKRTADPTSTEDTATEERLSPAEMLRQVRRRRIYPDAVSSCCQPQHNAHTAGADTG